MAAEGGEANRSQRRLLPADTAAALSSQLAVILRTIAGTALPAVAAWPAMTRMLQRGVSVGKRLRAAGGAAAIPATACAATAGSTATSTARRRAAWPLHQSCDAGSRCVRGLRGGCMWRTLRRGAAL